MPKPFRFPLTTERLVESDREISRRAALRRGERGGFGGTGLDWRYDFGPINPLADQPVHPRMLPPADRTPQFSPRKFIQSALRIRRHLDAGDRAALDRALRGFQIVRPARTDRQA